MFNLIANIFPQSYHFLSVITLMVQKLHYDGKLLPEPEEPDPALEQTLE